MIKMSFYHPYFERPSTYICIHFKKQSETDKNNTFVFILILASSFEDFLLVL